MKLIVRMYRTFDVDIIALFLMPGFDFRSAMADAIRACARKEAFYIAIPEGSPEADIKPKYATHILLDDREDADVIRWLMGIEDGYRNTAIKLIFRRYLPAVYFVPLSDTGERRTADMEAAFDVHGDVDYRFKKIHSRPVRSRANRNSGIAEGGTQPVLDGNVAGPERQEAMRESPEKADMIPDRKPADSKPQAAMPESPVMPESKTEIADSTQKETIWETPAQDNMPATVETEEANDSGFDALAAFEKMMG